jgi:two-component sensor histidine kinase
VDAGSGEGKMAEHSDSESLTIPASLDEIEQVRVFLKERLRKVPFQGDDLFHFDLAVFEILVNIVRYGYPGSAGVIRVDLRIGTTGSRSIRRRRRLRSWTTFSAETRKAAWGFTWPRRSPTR